MLGLAAREWVRLGQFTVVSVSHIYKPVLSHMSPAVAVTVAFFVSYTYFTRSLDILALSAVAPPPAVTLAVAAVAVNGCDVATAAA